MPFLIIIGVVLLIWIFVKAYNDYKKEKAYKETNEHEIIPFVEEVKIKEF